MNELLIIANPIAIVTLFIYQHYRLKFLSSSMLEQKKLLSETKDVVMQQATAINSQATVVDTAIKYSQYFDPKKIEEIIRRELALDFEGEKRTLEHQIDLLKGKHIETAKTAISLAAEKTAEHLSKLFTPLIAKYLVYLHALDSEQREIEIASITEEDSKKMIRDILQATSPLVVQHAGGAS